MQAMCAAEEKLESFADKLSATFQETAPKQESSIPKFEEQVLSTEGVFAPAIGAALAGTIGGFVNSVFPLGNLAIPVAGYLMMRFFKSGFLHGMGKGVLIAGIAVFLSGLTQGLGGFLGGGGARHAASGGMEVIY